MILNIERYHYEFCFQNIALRVKNVPSIYVHLRRNLSPTLSFSNLVQSDATDDSLPRVLEYRQDRLSSPNGEVCSDFTPSSSGSNQRFNSLLLTHQAPVLPPPDGLMMFPEKRCRPWQLQRPPSGCQTVLKE
jgi:hypothetical protein